MTFIELNKLTSETERKLLLFKFTPCNGRINIFRCQTGLMYLNYWQLVFVLSLPLRVCFKTESSSRWPIKPPSPSVCLPCQQETMFLGTGLHLFGNTCGPQQGLTTPASYRMAKASCCWLSRRNIHCSWVFRKVSQPVHSFCFLGSTPSRICDRWNTFHISLGIIRSRIILTTKLKFVEDPSDAAPTNFEIIFTVLFYNVSRSRIP